MGDMLFEKFLKELIDDDIQELNAILAYRGIAGILHEFELWLAHEGWLRDEDERSDDEEDEHEDEDDESSEEILNKLKIGLKNEDEDDERTKLEKINDALEFAEIDVKNTVATVYGHNNPTGNVWKSGADYALKQVQEHLK